MGLCGSGGRHLPQLHNNPNVELAAIVQRSEQPTAAAYLHTELESKTQLQERCEGMPTSRAHQGSVRMAPERVLQNGAGGRARPP